MLTKREYQSFGHLYPLLGTPRGYWHDPKGFFVLFSEIHKIPLFKGPGPPDCPKIDVFCFYLWYIFMILSCFDYAVLST